MIIITDEQKKKLNNYVDNLERCIKEDDLEGLLLAIDDAIIYHIGDDDEPDETGIMIQRIYDEIFEVN